MSLLYATVGQTAGTAFLALMAFSSFPLDQMRPTALTLNVIAALYSTWHFNRGRHIDWTKLWPFLIASVPAALVGGCVVLSGPVYSALTGLVFLAAAATIFMRRESTNEVEAAIPLGAAIGVGAVVGLLSGLTGLGGGVFLAPVVIALRWALPKQMAAMAAPFILINSAVALLGVLYAGQMPAPHTFAFGVAALLGAVIGTNIGIRFLSQKATNLVLAAILAIAGLQLLIF